jgi:hypothetical protein
LQGVKSYKSNILSGFFKNDVPECHALMAVPAHRNPVAIKG